jgi:hypothetical protein
MRSKRREPNNHFHAFWANVVSALREACVWLADYEKKGKTGALKRRTISFSS